LFHVTAISEDGRSLGDLGYLDWEKFDFITFGVRDKFK